MGNELADVIERFESMEMLINELRAIDDGYSDIETIEDLIDYLEDELEYSRE